MIEDRNLEPYRFLREGLDHQARRARTAARRAAHFVVIRLVAQHAAEPVLRYRQSHELQGRERARRTDGLDIGRVLVHRPAGAESVRHGAKVVAPVRAVGGVQRLLVGSRAGGRAAEGALGRDRDVDVAPLQFDRRPQSRGAAAENQRSATSHRQSEAERRDELVRRLFVGEPRHRDVGQPVEDVLGDRRAQDFSACWRLTGRQKTG